MTAVDTVPGAGATPGAPPTGAATSGRTGVPQPDADTAAGGPATPGTAGSRWRRVRRVTLAVAVAVAVAVGVAVAAADHGLHGVLGDDPTAPALGPGEVTVQVDVEHSLFVPESVRVVEGTRVRFVVVNGDPIDHELIVGPPDVHDRHASGTEAEHASIPGEVSVGANGTAITTFTFETVGTVEFACHLPGHYEHGMHGTVEVVRGVP